LLAELTELEPIFHTRKFGTTFAEFEQRMANDYWEVGASGRRYSRAEVLEHLSKTPVILADASGWQSRELRLRQLGEDIYLLTYCLLQGSRVSRRSSVWCRSTGRWRILYHQGTLVTG
jgi:hypothetical protein